MIVTRFFEPAIAQVSYLIGCAATGEAIVIDPNRDITRYVEAAAREGVRITHVTETHIHADFLSGARELARVTGAVLLLSNEGDADWKYGFATEGHVIHHGDRITVGNILIDVVHTPGHTSEHLTFLITDSAGANQPIAAATGDFIFVGDVGRPDLLERAVNQRGTMEKAARTLWRSLRAFDDHEEWLQIWPGHGAGSSCGKGISAIPYSTLGYERRFNWAFTTTTEDDFVARVLAGQPDPPAYFATMKMLNQRGPEMRRTTPAPRLDGSRLAALVAAGAPVVDTRPADAFAAGHVPGTLSIPLNSSFVTWAGWLLPYDRDLYVIVAHDDDARVAEVTRQLALIGLDRLGGVFAADAVIGAAAPGDGTETIPQITAAELASRLTAGTVDVIDVRNGAEWREGHIGAATHVPLGYLAGRIADLPSGKPLVLQCHSGSRSAVAASLLRRLGRREVVNLVGGLEAWRAAGLPVSGAAPAAH